MLLEMNVKLRRGQFQLNGDLAVSSINTGLFGQAGAGKSTLLGLIAGTIQPESGRIVLNDKILFDSRKGIIMPREQRPIGAVLQQDQQDSIVSVNSILNHTYQRTLKQRRMFKLSALIKWLNLEPLLEKSIKQLSSSQRQRVALARSLIKSPQLLLLDETFASIGDAYRLEVLSILKQLGLPVLYASQSLGDILQLTDQLLILEHGKILRNGSLRELAKQGTLQHLGIRKIDNMLSVTIEQHQSQSGYSLASCFGLPLILPPRPQLALGSKTQISIRANDIALSRQYINGISIQNQIKGRICALITNEHSVIVQIDCGETLLAEITPAACHDMGLQENDIIYCLIKTHAINYLTELDKQTTQRALNYEGNFYYLTTH
ncbi:Molybdenum import ATP-binding protein ModC [Patescibacteria group bacterium]|nr:Molybdenum import ATP-binding protein ModC [Patescibacteria group bacterium]